jgi:Family of unknown function (DUF5678)
MISNYEQILSQALKLPASERKRLIDALSTELGREPLPGKIPDRHQEMHWLTDHRHEYAGKWVVIEGDQLISHGENAQEVHQKALQAGISVPFLVHVEPQDQLPFGGW